MILIAKVIFEVFRMQMNWMEQGKNSSISGMNHLTPDNGYRLNMQTLERKFSNKMSFDVGNEIAMIETTLYDATLAAINNLVISRLELAIRSAKASLTRNLGRVAFDPDKRHFSGNTEDLHMTTWGRLSSNTDSNRFHETLCNITNKIGVLVVSKKEFDR